VRVINALLLLLLLFGMASCTREGPKPVQSTPAISPPPASTPEKVQSAYTLPTTGTPSEYIYVSTEYIAKLRSTGSHPAAVYALSGDRSPILFYSVGQNAYMEAPNLHEGGSTYSVEPSSDTAEVDGVQYNRYSVRKTVEQTLQAIIVDESLQPGTYSGGSTTLQLAPDDIQVNGVQYRIAIDVGGGYNDVSETMILPEDRSGTAQYYAIRRAPEGIVLTPLQSQDGPVLIKSGEPFLLAPPAK
jgi:hypothetical protein